MKRQSKRRICILLVTSIFVLAIGVDFSFYQSISYAHIVGHYSRIKNYAIRSADNDSDAAFSTIIHSPDVDLYIDTQTGSNSHRVNHTAGGDQSTNLCQQLDSNILEEKIHFYLKGTERVFVTMNNLLKQTNCLWCNDVCQNLISEDEQRNNVDSLGDKSWKHNLLNKMSDFIQAKLHHSQTPADCSSAKKVMCSLFHNNRGFGSQVHAMVYCLMLAYISNRTLVIRTERFRYGREAWEETFLPIGTCFTKDVGETTDFTDVSDIGVILESTAETITVPDVKAWRYPVPDFLFLAIPEDLAFSLTILNDDPASWWISQFMKYIFRLRPDLSADLKEEVESNFHGVVAGVHIRRTDSTVTGIYRKIEDYILPVISFYDRLKPAIDSSSRNIYVISDETSPFQELEEKYPSYNFIYNTTIAEKAVKKRNSLFGIVHDIHMLSHCDFVVCAASSNICRSIYEMVQSKGLNATGMFRFLDKLYFLSNKYQNRHVYKVIEPVVSNSFRNLNLEVGEIVERNFSNEQRGYMTGTRCKNNATGLFPVKKVKRVWLLTKLPSFKDIH